MDVLRKEGIASCERIKESVSNYEECAREKKRRRRRIR
jgi:hypothetical protein